MPKNRIKRGRLERTAQATLKPERERVKCSQCGAEQDRRAACRVCHNALVTDAVLDVDGRELDVRALLALTSREAAVARLVESGVDVEAAEDMLDAVIAGERERDEQRADDPA